MESIGTDAAAIEVLLVEDTRNDVLLTREALKNAKVHINLHVASDGVEAMAFLGRDGEHAGVPRPDLILLDMNLPKKNGRKVLEEIKQSATLKNIPVVILASSASDAEVLRKDGLHAEYFISKPVTLDGFLNVVKSIDRRRLKRDHSFGLVSYLARRGRRSQRRTAGWFIHSLQGDIVGKLQVTFSPVRNVVDAGRLCLYNCRNALLLHACPAE
jgi:two-component system, chemotaxis family, response regulator Rcp1